MKELKASNYRGRPNGCNDGNAFKPFNNIGFTSIEVLEFLKNKPWDDVALGFVHALRPEIIRVIQYNGGTQLDARTWRVTVYLNKDNKTIQEITQEVQVGLPKGCAHGWALEEALECGLDSEQVKWHSLEGMTCMGIGGTRKVLDDGTSVPYPKVKSK